MGIGVSVFLLAIGAILTFAVEASISGLDVPVVGIILMVAGAIGLLLSILAMNRRDTTVVEDRYGTRDRDVY